MKARYKRVVSVALNLYKTVKKLKIFLKSCNFDYLYTATPLNSFEFYLAFPQIMSKMVISEHASAFAVNKIYQTIKKFIYPKAYCISVPNKMDCEVYKLWRCNVVYIPHLASFKPQETNRLDSKIVLNVGRLTLDKRQIELIKIWSNVRNKKDWQLVIVGSGEEKEKLINEIKLYKLEKAVKIVGHTKNIESIYRNASIFAFTSRMEGFGMVLLEAMSFGIPCISYDCPSGPRDIIIDGKNGFLVRNNNSAEFTKKLEYMLEQSPLREMGQCAFETVKNWNNNGILQAWDKIFQN